MSSRVKDISGERFGSLVALTARRDGKRTIWTFRCECGRHEEFRADEMRRKNRPAITACTECSRMPCAICGKLFSRVGSGTTCGDAICKDALRRVNNRLFISRHNRTISMKRKKDHAEKTKDPAHRRALQDKTREYKRSPQGKDATKRYQEKNKAHISEYHRKRLDGMGEEGKARKRMNMRRHKTKNALKTLILLGNKMEGKLNDE